LSQLATFQELNLLDVGNQTVSDLRIRLGLTNDIIAMLRASSDGDEERTAACIEKVTEQQREINRRLVSAIKQQREQDGLAEPDSIKVKMKPIQMGVSAQRSN